jgi:hypothetical protein
MMKADARRGAIDDVPVQLSGTKQTLTLNRTHTLNPHVYPFRHPDPYPRSIAQSSYAKPTVHKCNSLDIKARVGRGGGGEDLGRVFEREKHGASVHRRKCEMCHRSCTGQG